MKKVLFSFALASVLFSACNNSKTEENATTETTTTEQPSGQISTDVINNTETASTQEVDPSKLAAMTFEKYSHDFGKVKEGEKVSYVFKFKNTGARG